MAQARKRLDELDREATELRAAVAVLEPLARERQKWVDLCSTAVLLVAGVAQWLDTIDAKAIATNTWLGDVELRAVKTRGWLEGVRQHAVRESDALNEWIAEVMARKGQVEE